jgi:hypothetical protein
MTPKAISFLIYFRGDCMETLTVRVGCRFKDVKEIDVHYSSYTI